MPINDDNTQRPASKGFGGASKPKNTAVNNATNSNAIANVERDRATSELNLQGAVGLAGHTVHDTIHQVHGYVDALTEQGADVLLEILHPGSVRAQMAGKLVGKLQSLHQGDNKGFSLGPLPSFSLPEALPLVDLSHLYPVQPVMSDRQLLSEGLEGKAN